MAPTALTVSALAFAQPQVSSGASTATPSRDLASSNSAPDDGDSVTVTFGGRLVMLPAIDPNDQLAHKDDIRFDVIGPRVELLDGRSSSRITTILSSTGETERAKASWATADAGTLSASRCSQWRAA